MMQKFSCTHVMNRDRERNKDFAGLNISVELMLRTSHATRLQCMQQQTVTRSRYGHDFFRWNRHQRGTRCNTRLSGYHKNEKDDINVIKSLENMILHNTILPSDDLPTTPACYSQCLPAHMHVGIFIGAPDDCQLCSAGAAAFSSSCCCWCVFVSVFLPQPLVRH